MQFREGKSCGFVQFRTTKTCNFIQFRKGKSCSFVQFGASGAGCAELFCPIMHASKTL